MEIESKLKKIVENLITPYFLKSIEKWARYKGKKFYIGDCDLSIENKGVFTKIYNLPKISITHDANGKMNIQISDTETIEHIKKFDVTIIRNNPVCSEYNTRVLIAECPDIYDNKLPELYVYAITGSGKSKRYLPTFAQLKKDFECGTYTSYNSMLHEFCNIYSIVPFTEYTDRFFNYSTLHMDLHWLNTDSVSKKLSESIVISDWRKYVEHKKTLNAMSKIKR